MDFNVRHNINIFLLPIGTGMFPGKHGQIEMDRDDP